MMSGMGVAAATSWSDWAAPSRPFPPRSPPPFSPRPSVGEMDDTRFEATRSLFSVIETILHSFRICREKENGTKPTREPEPESTRGA
eukprot:COSAG01_NODE_19613_length_1000_cov_1.542730_2_plen_86_part_01